MPVNHNNYDIRLKVSNDLEAVYKLSLEFVNDARNTFLFSRANMSEKFFYLFGVARTKLGQALWNLTSNSSTVNNDNAFNFNMPGNNFGYGNQNFRNLFNTHSNDYRSKVANIINYFHAKMSGGDIVSDLNERSFFADITNHNAALMNSAIALRKLGLFLYYRQINLTGQLTFP